MGCATESIPFIHLGVPMGQNMSRVNGWSSIMDRFRSILAGWKAKCLSVGGCLTLMSVFLGYLGSYLMSVFLTLITFIRALKSMRVGSFSGADLNERHIHWIRVDRVLASKSNDGLGVGGMLAFNRPMIFKWKCKSFHYPKLLWVGVVKAIYGPDGGCSSLSPRTSSNGPWNSMILMLPLFITWY